ncbi:MAG: valine--tRNA ligase [Candidatus Nealsonbacteria bacterium]
MKSEIPKVHNPKTVENRIYKLWLKSGFFNPDKLLGKRKKPFTIMLPPPNVTGRLHMGQALNAVINDILIRWKRLKGYRTLWLPGTDHAGIATQVQVEKELKREGKTRFDLGEKLFIKRVWQWKRKYGNAILEQFEKLGSSLDWSRTRFTMDKEYSAAVKKAFLNYYKKGLVYKKERPINWCSRCQTSLSDLEVDYKEEQGKLWYIRYPLKNTNYKTQTKKYIVVATTRPETMLGDTAVAVNPKDKRHKKLIGKYAVLPLVGREIQIITNRLVDLEFGTGAVKVTPAHDLKDYEIGISHNLDIIQVIDEEGKIKKNAPAAYQGLSILKAREAIVKDLKKLGLIEKIEDFSHQVPFCDRCKTKIEILPSKQWFVKMEKLAKMAEKEVRSGRIKFHPKRFEKIYFDWISNIKDWCISRQIWWGHKIPIEGSEDVLDTWFSSALWPFATLGWPKKTKDLKKFYPTDVLSTARDIINLWVLRMIFSGMEFIKKKPFRDVYIHPTVLTKEGRRMSKSLGTGIDPMILIEKYGADATRFGLAWQLMGGQDMRFAEDNIIMGKKFCNKIWNATRYILFQIQNSKLPPEARLAKGGKTQIYSSKLKIKKLTPADKKILEVLNKTIKSVDRHLENFRFGKAARILYEFFWHDFCDKYIEQSKSQIKNPKSKLEEKNTKKILFYVLLSSLKLLHPFIPFVTEEIYQNIPLKNKKKCLMIEDWPYSR